MGCDTPVMDDLDACLDAVERLLGMGPVARVKVGTVEVTFDTFSPASPEHRELTPEELEARQKADDETLFWSA